MGGWVGKGSAKLKVAQQGHCEPPLSAQGEPQRLPAACHRARSSRAMKGSWSNHPAAPQVAGGGCHPGQPPPYCQILPAGAPQPLRGQEPRQGHASTWEHRAACSLPRGIYSSSLQPSSCCSPPPPAPALQHWPLGTQFVPLRSISIKTCKSVSLRPSACFLPARKAWGGSWGREQGLQVTTRFPGCSPAAPTGTHLGSARAARSARKDTPPPFSCCGWTGGRN